MASARVTSRQSSNGNAASDAVAKARQAGDSVATAARAARGPAIAAGAAVAGIAGGVVLGARMSSKRRKVLGLPLGRKRPMVRAAEGLLKVAGELGSATGRAAATTEDLREIRDQLDKANRQSPLEVVLDGLTHRRGAHRRES